MKGKKFFASTPNAKVWFDGKTQWSYMQATDEVNISTPTQAEQMQANPYSFIFIYKTGYNMSMKQVGGDYEVHLVAQNQKKNRTRTIYHHCKELPAEAHQDAPEAELDNHRYQQFPSKEPK